MKKTSRIETKTLIDWLRDYAEKRIDSRLIDECKNVSPHIYLDLGNQGFFGLHVEKKYGGLELKATEILHVIEQVAAVDLTLAIILIESIQGAHALGNYATESIKNHYLPKLAAGRIFTAGAMTESEAGSNPRVMHSYAIKGKDHHWVINGSKRWVGMGAQADIIAIYAQEYDANNKWLGMTGFLVPQSTKGLIIGPESPTMGLRGFSKYSLTMHELKIHAAYLLGKPGEGMEIAQNNMMYVRLCLGAASIGAMKRCMQLMMRYAKKRQIATGLLLDNPITIARLSEMTAIIEALDAFVYFISSFYDSNGSVPEEAFIIAKILGSEYLGKASDLLVQTLGARGYEEASGISQIFRDARTFRIFEGPTEALNMYLGSRVVESNFILEHFIVHQLKQKPFFDAFQELITRIKGYSLSHKRHLFPNNIALNYWVQSIAGEMITYGFLLSCLNFKAEEKKEPGLERAIAWVQAKYRALCQKALTISVKEQLILEPSMLIDTIYGYETSIGDITQTREITNVFIDSYLESEVNQKPEFLLTQEGTELLVHTHKPTTETGSVYKHEGKKKNHIAYVHELFEIHADKTPDAIALIQGEEKLTYSALNIKANFLAQHLKKKGVKKGSLIAIYCDRSIEMVIGILGIFKLGCTYLPLDSTYPLNALKFMCLDSNVETIISKKSLHYASLGIRKKIFFEDVFHDKIDHHYDNLNEVIADDALGYVIYSSGSTGKPKGSMLPHRALANLIAAHNAEIDAPRRVLQFTPISFDMSFLEIFSALTMGGTLILISDEDKKDISTFSKIVKNYHIEQLILPVSYLVALASSKINAAAFQTLKEIIIAGEQLHVSPRITEFFSKLSFCALYNYYGPSETHVVTIYKFPQDKRNWPYHPPIGQPINHVQVLLLDEERKPVPFGSEGEIYLTGLCLARGYINNKKLTEEKFIRHSKYELMYRTGDIAKYLPDGNLLFLGRKDEQVKISGFRVEIQEIEINLMKYPGIQAAAVIVKESFVGKYLEAFITYEEGKEKISTQAIYSFLKEMLPGHMIPRIIHVIYKMPLTSSGKINKLELMNREITIDYSVNNLALPKTEVEREITSILERIFTMPIDINASFLSQGGNSLMAMHITNRLKERFLIEIPAYTILSDSTLGETARTIELLITIQNSINNERDSST